MERAINALLPCLGSTTCLYFFFWFSTNMGIIALCLVPRFSLGWLPARANRLMSQVLLLAFTRSEFHVLSFQAIKFSPICSDLPWTLRESDMKNNQNRDLKPNQLFVHNLDLLWIVTRYTPIWSWSYLYSELGHGWSLRCTAAVLFGYLLQLYGYSDQWVTFYM